MKCSFDISNFLEENSGLFHSLVFFYSLQCSFKKAFLSLLGILWNSTFSWVYISHSPLSFASLLSSTICKASSENHFAFLHFFFFGMILVTASCTMLQTSFRKEINYEYSLEGLMLKLKLQHFGHLMQRTESLEKTLMLGKIEGRRRRGWQGMRLLEGIIDLMDMSLSKLWEWWWTGKPGVLESMGSQRFRYDWTDWWICMHMCKPTHSLTQYYQILRIQHKVPFTTNIS